MTRSAFAGGYRFALRLLGTGCLLLGAWLLVLILNALDITTFSFGTTLLEWGALLAAMGILFGSVLDWLALRRDEKRAAT